MSGWKDMYKKAREYLIQLMAEEALELPEEAAAYNHLSRTELIERLSKIIYQVQHPLLFCRNNTKITVKHYPKNREPYYFEADTGRGVELQTVPPKSDIDIFIVNAHGELIRGNINKKYQ